MKTWRLGWLWFLCLGVLWGCEPAPAATQPTITRAPSLAPSATVLPVIQPEDDSVSIGRSDPTAAALAAEGEPSSEPILTPIPTEASFPLTIVTEDNHPLTGIFYGTQRQPAPAILILPAETGDLSRLSALASQFQSLGYQTLILNYRGGGTASGTPDWSKTPLDAQAALATLGSLPNVTSIGVLAEGASAGTALLICQNQPTCFTLMLIDPLPHADLPALTDLLPTLNQPVLLLADSGLSASYATAQSLAGQLSTASLFQTVTPLNGTPSDYQSPLAAWISQKMP